MIWNMNSEQLFITFSFLCGFTFIGGWVADHIMGYSGFGTYGNWLILLSGTYAGMYGFNKMGYMFHWNPPLTVAVVSGVACMILIVLAMVKTVVSQ